MEIILLERVPNLGMMGDIVTVKGGFARNFLLPQGKALPATKENLSIYEARKQELQAENDKRRKEAEALVAQLESTTITVKRQASEVGQLYGSVKPGDLQKELTAQGYEIPRGAVQLAEPIKTVGEYTADIVLHPEVTMKMPVTVSRLVL